MKVRCVSDTVTNEQRVQLGLGRIGSTWPLRPGKEYLVLGISFYRGSLAFGTGMYLEIVPDELEYVVSIPLDLFEVVDGRCSATWSAQHYPNGGFTLWPLGFYKAYFHDQLSDGAPWAVDELQKARQRLEKEYEAQLPSGSSVNLEG